MIDQVLKVREQLETEIRTLRRQLEAKKQQLVGVDIAIKVLQPDTHMSAKKAISELAHQLPSPEKIIEPPTATIATLVQQAPKKMRRRRRGDGHVDVLPR